MLPRCHYPKPLAPLLVSQFFTRRPRAHYQPHVLYVVLPPARCCLHVDHRPSPASPASGGNFFRPRGKSNGTYFHRSRSASGPSLLSRLNQALSHCLPPSPSPPRTALVFALLLAHACRRLAECAGVHVWTKVQPSHSAIAFISFDELCAFLRVSHLQRPCNVLILFGGCSFYAMQARQCPHSHGC